MPNSLICEPDFTGVRYVLRPNAGGVHEFGSDPRGQFEPGAKLTDHINSLGFRGLETTREKPAGVFRIAALGDSVLFGTGVRAEDVMTVVLERNLNNDGRKCEILNLAVMGYVLNP